MSRENYVLKLHQDKDTPVFVLVSSITMMHVQKFEDKKSETKVEKTIISFKDGMTVAVLESPAMIIQMGKKYGVIHELV